MAPTDSTTTELLTRSVTEVFNERDPERRAQLVAATYAADVVFHDPAASVQGREALSAAVATLQEGGEGLVFSLRRPVQESVGLGLTSWQLAAPGGDPVVTGTDVALVSDGLITTMWTVLDG